ncbi:MAG: acyl-CoA desaturase [Cyanobacteria bacterium P01_F01_bin.150]
MIESTQGLYLPTYASREGFKPGVCVGMAIVHIIACLAPWYYTPYSLPLLLGGWMLTGGIGISIGYHRLLAHRSFDTFMWLKYLFATFGVLSVQSGPITWVGSHRLHHRFTDQELDIHTPKAGFLWGHMGWIVFEHPMIAAKPLGTYAADIAKDPVFQVLDRYYLGINILLGIILLGIGYLCGGMHTALSFLIWGGFLRIVFTWHCIFSVNSVCHYCGYRNFDLSDDSYNNPLVSLLTFGEGWHNNHHFCPSSASLSLRPFEIDVAYYFIALLQKLGLAWNVRVKTRNKST